MIHLSPRKVPGGRRKSMDPVSEFIHLEELPNPEGRFELHELLGTGTSAKVYAATDKEKGGRVAVKMISNIAENILEIESEYRVFSSIRGNCFIPEFYGIYKNITAEGRSEIWFVMELCDGFLVSSLLKTLRQHGKRLQEEHIGILLKSILVAIHNLHENDVIHRDIRASNFLLNANGEMKLIDYGSCALVKNTNGKAHSSIGTPYWMAPEVIACEQKLFYSKSCDIWSLGITAIELAETEPPLCDIHAVRAMFQIARNPPPTMRKGSEWSDAFKDFVQECLVRNAEHRPCTAELMFHPFIMEADETDKQVSLEEYLEQKFIFLIGEKGKKILNEVVEMAKTLGVQSTAVEPSYLTVKNWHLKKNPDAAFEKVLPEDVACLENICDESIMDLLNQRLLRNEAYTFIGDILLSINPTKTLPIYNTQHQREYCEKARSDNAPHIYAVADRAYQQMLHHKRSQVVILQGLSCTGKSFLTTHLVNQLSFLGQSACSDIATKIPHLCFLLDCFGNARILSNLNASRYFKTISITFTKRGKITGAVIDATLLDLSRVSLTPQSECNFHAFYYIYEGLKSKKRLSEFGLDKLTAFKYLPKKGEIESKELNEQYVKLLQAFRSLVFTDEEILAVLKMISTILLLGDIKFSMKGKEIVPTDAEIFGIVSDNPQIKKWKFTTLFSKCKTVEEANKKKHALAQFLYINLFEWIVNVVNRQLSFSRLVLGDSNSVHVIDPPGFQNNEDNQLFQLTTNMINDHLHNHIQRLMFLEEMEEYKKEGVDIPFPCEDSSFIKEQYSSNIREDYSSLLKLIQKATEDRSFIWKDNFSEFVKSSRISFENNKFSVQHIFEKVYYNSDDIMKAENDMHTEFQAILKTTSDHVTEPVFNKVSPDLATNVQQSQQLLSKVLGVFTEDFPHMVICMKTNHNLSKEECFRDEIAMHQLHVFKLQETAILRQKGYARRLQFSEFLNRYKYLAFDFDEDVELSKDNCRLLLIRLKMDGWKIGENKVFLNYYSEEYLSRLYETHVKKIVKIQAMARRFIVKARQKKQKY